MEIQYSHPQFNSIQHQCFGYSTNYSIKIGLVQHDIEDYRTLLNDIINNLEPDIITCYADGSKTEAGNGAVYIITTNNNAKQIHEASLSLPNHCTVFQAELCTIKEAWHHLHCRELRTEI